jgi:hypothetical protein
MSGGESFNMAEEFADVDFNEARLETLSRPAGQIDMGKQQKPRRS